MEDLCRKKQPVFYRCGLAGTFIAVWALTSLFSGLYRVEWEVSELARQWLIATGLIQPMHTLVDFYTHIKGIEYIICVIFFVAFPLYFRFLDQRKTKIKTLWRRAQNTCSCLKKQ